MDHANPRRWWHRPAAALAAGAVAAAALATSAAPARADAQDQPDRDASWSASMAVPAPVSADLVDQATAAAGEVRGAVVDEAASVADYWTAERMDSAIPADEPDRDQTGLGYGRLGSGALSPASPPDRSGSTDWSDPPTVVAEPAPAATADTDADADADESPLASQVEDYSPTNGKVFFRNQADGRDYVCSGSAVNSPAKRLVLTAGHCVHGGPGGTWHANWVFAPGYDHGPGPQATFPAASFRALDEWIRHGANGRGFNADVAFVTTQDNEHGQTVVDAVGGHGVATGGSPVFEASLFGYPMNLDAGERMRACRGTTGTQQLDTFLFPSISGCDFGGGSSGGPWLDQYDDASGLGYVRSVTSFGPAGSTAYVNGPYFDQRIAEMFDAADGDWNGAVR